jgi:hypothetical protein
MNDFEIEPESTREFTAPQKCAAPQSGLAMPPAPSILGGMGSTRGGTTPVPQGNRNTKA